MRGSSCLKVARLLCTRLFCMAFDAISAFSSAEESLRRTNRGDDWSTRTGALLKRLVFGRLSRLKRGENFGQKRKIGTRLRDIFIDDHAVCVLRTIVKALDCVRHSVRHVVMVWKTKIS